MSSLLRSGRIFSKTKSITSSSEDEKESDTSFEDTSEGIDTTIVDNFPEQLKLVKKDLAMSFSTAMSIVPSFSGNPRELYKFSRCCRIADKLFTATDKPTMMDLMEIKLVGKAYDVLKYKKFTTYTELETELNAQFLAKKTKEQIQVELISVRQGPRESMTEYANRVENLLSDLDHATSDKLPENASQDTKIAMNELNASTALEAFTQNMREPFRTIIRASRFASLAEAIKGAVNEELYFLNVAQPSNTGPPRFSQNFTNKFPAQNRSQVQNRIPNHDNSPNQNNAQRQNGAPNYPQPLICNYCKRYGHHISKCRLRPPRSFPKQTVNTVTAKDNNQQPKNVSGPSPKAETTVQTIQGSN